MCVIVSMMLARYFIDSMVGGTITSALRALLRNLIVSRLNLNLKSRSINHDMILWYYVIDTYFFHVLYGFSL